MTSKVLFCLRAVMYHDCGDTHRLSEFNRFTAREVILLMLVHHGVVVFNPLPRQLMGVVVVVSFTPVWHEGVVKVADVDEGEVSGFHTTIGDGTRFSIESGGAGPEPSKVLIQADGAT